MNTSPDCVSAGLGIDVIEAEDVPMTPWFPPHIKPARVGWYDTKLTKYVPLGDLISRRHWNGIRWSFASSKTQKSATQDWHWRGRAAGGQGA